jgi:TRAP-type C4-dicarboxylate transport system substrate-binding protein
MCRTGKGVVFSLFISLALVFTGLTGMARAGDTIRWKIQSAYPRGDFSMDLLNSFAKTVDVNSHGRLKISIFAAPEIVPGDQLFDATKRGTLDGLQALGAMWAGVVPVGEVELGLPYMYLTPGQTFKESAYAVRKFFKESGYLALLRKEYAKQGLYYLDFHSYGPNVILSKKPVRSCADLKGLKITVEGSFSDFYQALGATPVVVSGDETYMALKLGTIDAAQWDVSAITAFKWYEVAPYWLRGGENQQSFGHILLNQKSWQALPDDLKKVVQDAADKYYNDLVDVYDKQLKMADALVAAGKIKESWLDDSCKQEFQTEALKVWDSVAARNPASAEAIQMIKKWRGL